MAIEKTYLTGSGVQLGTSHFDLQAQKPLDSRTTVPEFAGLQALIDGKAAYEGMIVYDEETKKHYKATLTNNGLIFEEFGGSAGTLFETDETLSLKDGVLSVNTADVAEEDNTLPITSAAVATQVGNIEILLKTI